MKLKLSLAYVTILEMYIKCHAAGGYKHMVEEALNSDIEYDFSVYSEVYISSKLFTGRSTNATRLLCQIIKELHPYNALWYYDPGTSRYKSNTLKELRTAGILLKTEDKCIHIVNPARMGKGVTILILDSTKRELEDVTKVTTDNIKPLSYEWSPDKEY